MVADISDEIIMSRVKNGDLAELSVLFERYHVKLYNFMLKMTADRSISQDLTQNLFYRIMKYRQTFREEHSFKSWIYQMARNVHLDYCRQQKKLSDHHIHAEEYEDKLLEEKGSFEEEEFNRLDKAMSLLSPEQKEILVLSKFQRLKYEEISAIQKASVASVKVQVHRAIKQLRQYYFKLI